MTRAHDLPQFANLGDQALSVQVIVITRPEGGWHVTGVLYRQGGGPVKLHDQWSERWASGGESSLDDEWTYLANRILDGQGGNFYSYELEGFEVAAVDDIAPLVTARAAEIVVSTFGPLGELAGTFDSAYAIDGVTMPFVVLRDDRGHVALVATGSAIGKTCAVQLPDVGDIPALPFESVEYWQRAGTPSWPLSPRTVYQVAWDTRRINLEIDVEGKIVRMY